MRGNRKAALGEWLADQAGFAGPFELTPLAGGNSNETLLLANDEERLVMRRPPGAHIDPSAHDFGREARVLAALGETPVPAPRFRGLCTEPTVPEAPFLLMEWSDGVPLKEELPAAWDDAGAALRAVGGEAVDALADLHGVDWRAVGLEGLGRPEGFLGRQVPRWRSQYERHRVRELADFEVVAGWLEENLPADGEPGILHGDFHVDNCLYRVEGGPRLNAVIDWELATIGDPLLDVGLFLAFWGSERSLPLAMPAVQAVSRLDGAPSRAELAARYESRSGRSLERLDWYLAFAFWKLAAIVEGAYAQHRAGTLDSAYAAALEHDVPALLREARAFAGI